VKVCENDPDFSIIARTLAGETHAFDELVDKYYQRMFNLAYRMTMNEADAQDIIQQAFLKSFVHLGQFKRKSSFATWLYRITTNLALNNCKGKRRIHVSLRENDIVDQDHGLKTLESREEVSMVRQAIEKLPDRQRATLVLRVYEKLPFQEIATIMHCSEGGAKANYFQAIVKMKDRLKDYIAGKERLK